MPTLTQQLHSLFGDAWHVKSNEIIDALADAIEAASEVPNPDETQLDKGTVSSGTVTFDRAADGSKQKLTVGGNLTIAFDGWPATGIYGETEIELVNGSAHTITWPTVHWLKGDGSSSTTFANMGVVLQSSGTNFVTVWTTDGGTTVYGIAA